MRFFSTALRRLSILIVSTFIKVAVVGQTTAIDSLLVYHTVTAENSGKIQQEMIYLHLDNTSYYRGDRIFFACYLVTSGKLQPSNLSQTVYVELLNPGGKIIDRCVLKATEGRCHGSLLVDETPFYSGYYEIRAYTRYMLNFGATAIYSRVIPVFAEPKIEGDWADRRMLKYGSSKHPFSRPKPVRIATSKPNRNGIDISVANSTDSVAITVTSLSGKAMLGASLMCRGELCGRAILDLSETPSATFKVARGKLPQGVIQLVLFDVKGAPIAEQLFFNNRGEFITMEYSFDKEHYGPFEPVELTVRLSEPVPFSLSVTDAANHVAYGSDIRSDLLLGTEIRGFVPDLGEYLDNPDSLLLAQGRYRYSWNRLAGMEPHDIEQLPERGIEVRGSVQGSLRNKGKQGVTVSMMLNSMINDTTDTFLEEFVTDSLGRFAFYGELHGDWAMTLSATNKGKRTRNRILLNQSERPAPRAYDVTEMQYDLADTPIMLTDSADSDEELIKELERRGVKRLNEVEVTANGGHAADVRQYIENAVTSYDVAAARSLLQDQGKKFIRRVSDIMPLIDPNFLYANGKLLYGTKEPLYIIDDDLANNRKVLEYSDIDSSNPADLSVDMVKNIYVNTQPHAISYYATKFMEENLDIVDDFIPDEMKESLLQILPSADRDMANRDFRSNTYQVAISRIYGCVLFIELGTNNAGIIRPGMRRAIVEGYTDTEAFRHPDYHAEPPVEPDCRRTLYWDPKIIPNENGIARIRFYNNSTAKAFNVTATTIDSEGKLGALVKLNN